MCQLHTLTTDLVIRFGLGKVHEQLKLAPRDAVSESTPVPSPEDGDETAPLGLDEGGLAPPKEWLFELPVDATEPFYR